MNNLNLHSFRARRTRLFASVAAIVIIAAGGAATAQEQAEVAVDSEGLDVITVTAQKRVQNVQDVPISIQAFSAEEIEMLGLTELEDLSMRSPNLVIAGGSGEDLFDGETNSSASVRGLPGAGTYIDGVYQAFGSNLLSSNFFDIEQAAVLYGPQGTLFGRNTMGGAIQITTAGPSDDLSGYVRGAYGSFNRVDVAGSVSVPLHETFAVKGSVGFVQDDGWLENTAALSPDVADKNDLLYRIDALWEPLDALSARFIYTHNEFDRNGQSRLLLSPDSLQGERSFDPNSLPDSVAYDVFADSWFEDRDSYVLNVNYDINDNLTVRSITGYLENERGLIQDLDGTENLVSDIVDFATFDVNIAIALWNRGEDQSFSQEFELLGDYDRTDFVLGYYRWDDDSLVLGGGFTAPSLTRDESEGNSVFGDVTYDVTDKLSVSFGARYDDIEIVNTGYNLTADQLAIVSELPGAFSFENPFDPTAPTEDGARAAYEAFTGRSTSVLLDTSGGIITSSARSNGTADPSDDDVGTDLFVTENSATSVKANVSYNFTDDLMAFVTYAEGFNAGGVETVTTDFDADPDTPDTTELFFRDPEEVANIDIGVRSDWMNNTLRVNATAFYADYTDAHVTQQVSDFNGNLIEGEGALVNAAEGRSVGMELDVNWAPVERWLFDFAYGYTDAKYTGFDDRVDPDQFNEGTPFFGSPKNSFTVSGTYSTPFLGGEVMANLNYAWKDNQPMTQDEGNLLIQDAYYTLNGRINYIHGDGRWQASVIGTNMTDQKYLTTAFPSDLFGSIGTINEEAYFGGELRYNFGG